MAVCLMASSLTEPVDEDGGAAAIALVCGIESERWEIGQKVEGRGESAELQKLRLDG